MLSVWNHTSALTLKYSRLQIIVCRPRPLRKCRRTVCHMTASEWRSCELNDFFFLHYPYWRVLKPYQWMLPYVGKKISLLFPIFCPGNVSFLFLYWKKPKTKQNMQLHDSLFDSPQNIYLAVSAFPSPRRVALVLLEFSSCLYHAYSQPCIVVQCYYFGVVKKKTVAKCCATYRTPAARLKSESQFSFSKIMSKKWQLCKVLTSLVLSHQALHFRCHSEVV